MRFLKVLLLVIVGSLFAGCSTAPPFVSLSKEFYQNPNTHVGLVVMQPETPSFTWEGDVGLIEAGIIKVATASLDSHVKTLDLAEFKTIENELAEVLRQKGFTTQVIAEVPDLEKLKDFSDPDTKDAIYFAEKDMTHLAKELGVDYLVWLRVSQAGVARPYHGFIPMGAPRAAFYVACRIFDLRSNRLLWKHLVIKANSPDGNWDEPPSFPGLSNSFYVTLEQAKKEIVDTLANPEVTVVADAKASAAPSK